MLRALAPLCLIVLVAAACGGDRPVLVGELRSDAPSPVAEEVVTEEPGLARGVSSDEGAESAAGDRTVLQLGVVGDPIFDPMQVSVVDPQQMALIDLVADGLTEWDPQRNTWAPALATQIETLDDGRTWRFDLGSAAFSDGTPIAAHDVVRSFQRIMADSLSLPATRLEIVQSVAAVGEGSVEFVLAEPFADFPALVSSPVYGIVPDGALDGTITSGPFVADADGVLLSSTTSFGFELVSSGRDSMRLMSTPASSSGSSIRRNPPVDYQQRLINVEALPEKMQGLFFIPNLHPDMPEPIEMEPYGRSMMGATMAFTFPKKGRYRLVVELMEEDELIKTLRLTLQVKAMPNGGATG